MSWAPYQEQVDAEVDRLSRRRTVVSAIAGNVVGASVGVALVTLSMAHIVVAATLLLATVSWFVWQGSVAGAAAKVRTARKGIARREGFCWYCLVPTKHRARSECDAERAAYGGAR